MTGSCNNLDGTYECRCPDERPYGDGRIGGIGCYSLAELQGGIIGFSGQSSDVETVSTTNENDKNNNVANQIKETVIQIDLPVQSNVTTTQTSQVSTTKFSTTTTKAKTTTTTATTSTRKTTTTTTEATTSHVEVLIAEFTSPIINNDFDCAGQGLVCDFFRNDSKSLKIC